MLQPFTHFGRRFDDLHTEVVLLEQRLVAGTGDARKVRSAASALAETLPTAHVLGDVDSLAARLARSKLRRSLSCRATVSISCLKVWTSNMPKWIPICLLLVATAVLAIAFFEPL